jgi:hypothetical protein
MAYRLSRCQIKDRSLWWLFVRQAEPIDRVTPRSPPLLPFNKEEQDKEEQDKEHFFLCALYQGKARSAWWAGEGIAVERWWWLMEWYVSHIIPEEERLCVQRDIEALRNYECLLGYSSSEYDRILRGVVVLRLCIRRQPHVSKESMVSSYCVRYQGRALSLPVMSLYGVCRRGRITSKETTGGELWHVMEEMKGCPYWDDVLEGEGIQDTHFPNDLPDEWSSAEKEKSHGMGLLRDGERPTLWGYTRRYMMGVARLVWQAGSMVPLQQRLEEMKWEEGVSPFVALVRGMADVPPSPSPSLRPVHKKGVIQP